MCFFHLFTLNKIKSNRKRQDGHSVILQFRIDKYYVIWAWGTKFTTRIVYAVKEWATSEKYAFKINVWSKTRLPLCVLWSAEVLKNLESEPMQSL